MIRFLYSRLKDDAQSDSKVTGVPHYRIIFLKSTHAITQTSFRRSSRNNYRTWLEFDAEFIVD